MIIKVCGMTDPNNINEVEGLDVDMIGFIFYPLSPRFVGKSHLNIPEFCKRVGVFVNTEIDTILSYASSFQLQYIQLHGDEGPDVCQKLKLQNYKIIKAFSLSCEDDIKNIDSRYEEFCDYYLFDTKSHIYGGSGQRFNWSLLNSYKGNIQFLLSGGINPASVEDLKKFHHPLMAGIDLNSGFELSPGLKDIQKLRHFISKIKQ